MDMKTNFKHQNILITVAINTITPEICIIYVLLISVISQSKFEISLTQIVIMWLFPPFFHSLTAGTAQLVYQWIVGWMAAI
jgi:hypothetical protein